MVQTDTISTRISCLQVCAYEGMKILNSSSVLFCGYQFILRISISDFVFYLCCPYLYRFLSIKIRLGYLKDLKQASQDTLPQGTHRGKKKKKSQTETSYSYSFPELTHFLLQTFPSPPHCVFLKSAFKSSYKIGFWAEGLESRQTPTVMTKLELESQIKGHFNITEGFLQY